MIYLTSLRKPWVVFTISGLHNMSFTDKALYDDVKDEDKFSIGHYTNDGYFQFGYTYGRHIKEMINVR